MTKRKKITDEQFIAGLKAHKGKTQLLAKELGISPQAVNKRKARILKNQAKDQGKVLAVVQQIEGRPEKQVAAIEAEVLASAAACHEQFSAIQEMRGMFGLSVRLQREILARADRVDGATTPKERYQLLAVMERAESILRAYHTVEKDIYNAGMIRVFMERVLSVIATQSPETQKQLYEAFKSAEPVFRAIEGLLPAPTDP